MRFIRVGADWHAVKKMAIVVSRIDRCTENPSKNAIRTVNFANGSNIVAGTSVTAVYDNLSFTIQSVPGPIVGNGHGLHPWEAEVIRLAGAFADRLVLASNPAVEACRRMRLPADYLYVPPAVSDHRSGISR